MFFSKYLLLSDKLENHVDILNGVKQGVLPSSCFILCINNTSNNLMDIYYCEELKKPHINMDNLLIIAICKDKTDAKEKCAEILGDFVAKNKSLDGFREKYLQGRLVASESEHHAFRMQPE